MTDQDRDPRAGGSPLLAAACPDAALLYLYLHTGGDAAKAGPALRFSGASWTMPPRRCGRWGFIPSRSRATLCPPRPRTTPRPTSRANTPPSPEFPAMVGEAQRRLGRILSTEELKIFLCIYRYLGLPVEVISILIHYCIRKTARADPGKMPSVRAIEKEAYRWADLGIDTIEEAAVYMQNSCNCSPAPAVSVRSSRSPTAAHARRGKATSTPGSHGASARRDPHGL